MQNENEIKTKYWLFDRVNITFHLIEKIQKAKRNITMGEITLIFLIGGLLGAVFMGTVLVPMRDTLLLKRNSAKQISTKRTMQYYHIWETSGIVIPKDYDSTIVDTIQFYGQKYDCPDSISFRMAYFESNLDPNVPNGIVQVFPETKRSLYKKLHIKVDNVYNQIHAALYYLHKEFERYNDRWDLALSSYNSNKVTADGHVNPASEKYVNKIINFKKQNHEKN